MSELQANDCTRTVERWNACTVFLLLNAVLESVWPVAWVYFVLRSGLSSARIV